MESHGSIDIKQTILSVLSDKDIKVLMDKQKSYSYCLFMHGVSVATFAAILMLRMDMHDLPNITLEEIIRGALLHDIGKVYISKKILEKSGCLTKKEFSYIKKHPVFGCEQVGNLLGQKEKEIIMLHHEKLDGSGYPYGKKDIPLYVQIVTVADMYDALISRRSYKRVYTHKEAIKILEKEVQSGKINEEILCELDIVINNKAMTRKT